MTNKPGSEPRKIETQWFRGQLEGHYVGISAGAPVVAEGISATRYKMRIYRALIREIEVLDYEDTPDSREEAPNPPFDEPDACFYQAQIDDTRLIGLRRRGCFEGTVYDVSIHRMKVTHSTRKGDKTYGRVLGEVHGRFLLPSEPETPPEMSQAMQPVAAEAAPGAGAEEALRDANDQSLAETRPLVAADLASLARDPASEGPGPRDLEPLHPPALPKDESHTRPPKIPVGFLVIAMAIALGLGAGSEPALLWLGLFTPILIIRYLLHGMFEVTSSQRVVGAILVLAQAVCLGAILLDWWTIGCKSMSVWAIAGIGSTVLLASLLPSAVAMACNAAGLGLVLFLYYGNVGVLCELPDGEVSVEETIERPTVSDPGRSRTNEDGSWPRRPPRPQP